MGKQQMIVALAVLGGLVTAGPVSAASEKKRQQRIAYWVDGYRVAKGEVVVGSVAFDKFDRPIAALVDDCKASPKETLWQKAKKYL